MKSLFSIALATLVSLLLAGSATAHDVTPTNITLRPGGTDFIYVADGGTCPATITVSTTDAPTITIQAINMTSGALVGQPSSSVSVPNRVDQVFVVKASSAIETATVVTAEVCWIGANYPNGPCNENNCSPFTPTVVTITILSAPSTVGTRLSSGVSLDPVATATGELFLPEGSDIELGGPMPLGLWRNYFSNLESDGAIQGSLGPNWLHNFDWRLTQVGNAIEVQTSEGRVARFERGYLDSDYTLALYRDIPFQLVASGPGHELYDPRDGYTYNFDFQGLLTSIEDGRGNAHTLSYSSGRLDQVTDGLGRTLTFAYGGSGELNNVTDGTRNVLFGWDASGRLQTATDALGHVTTYGYDAAVPADALLTTRTLPEGNTPWTQTWNSGRVATQADALGNTWTYTYDLVNFRTTVLDPTGESRIFRHDSQGSLTRWEDEGGDSAVLGNDNKGRRNQVTDRDGKSSSISYDALSGGLKTVDEADGSQLDFQYISRLARGITKRDLSRAVWPGNMQIDYTHDADGNALSEDGPGGAQWAYGYNSRGQPTSVTSPLGAITTLAYNADGTLASLVDHDGSTTTLGYDGFRRLDLVTYDDGSTISYGYDLCDRVTGVTDELSRTLSFAYDDNGNLTSSLFPNGSYSFTYDLMDRALTRTDALGAVSTATFDSLGRNDTVSDPNGNLTTFGFDPLGRLSSTTNDKGKVWHQGYTLEGVPATRTNPLGETESYTSDARGRLRSRRSPTGATSSFAYDGENRLSNWTSRFGSSTSLSYGQDGLLGAIQMDLPGLRTTIERNALGQVTELDGPGGGSWAFGYDAKGRQTFASDPLGRTLTNTYSSDNAVSQLDLAGLGSVSYSYDPAQRLTGASFSDGLNLTYSWSATDKLELGLNFSASYDAADRISSVNGIGIGRDLGGRISSMTYAPGFTVTYDYNDDNSLSRVTDWVGGFTDFSYDDAGNTKSITRPNGVRTTFDYDLEGALTRIDHGLFGSLNYTRSASGRVRSVEDLLLGSGVPALADWCFTFDDAQQATDVLFDSLGRQLEDLGEAFIWNLAGQLLQRDDGVQPIDYTYDTFGMLHTRTAGALTTRFTYNYATALPSLAYEEENGSVARRYVYTPTGRLLHSIEDGTNARSFFHFDADFNTRGLTDDAGLVTDTYDYTPFGMTTARSGTSDLRFQWRGGVGAWRESDSDHYNNCGRWYNARRARHASPSAVQQVTPAMINRYAIDGNVPTTFGDQLRTGLPPGTANITIRGLDAQSVSPLYSPGNATNLPEFVADLPVGRVANFLFAGQPATAGNFKEVVRKFRERSLSARHLAWWRGSSSIPIAPGTPDRVLRGPFGPQSGMPQIGANRMAADEFEWESITPRLGFTYALGNERRTLLRSHHASNANPNPSVDGSTLSALGSFGYFGFSGPPPVEPLANDPWGFDVDAFDTHLPQGTPQPLPTFDPFATSGRLPGSLGLDDPSEFNAGSLSPRPWRYGARLNYR